MRECLDLLKPEFYPGEPLLQALLLIGAIISTEHSAAV